MRLMARTAPFLIPIGIAAFATNVSAGSGRGSGPATTSGAGKAAEAGAEPAQVNAAERKAVRGAPLDDPDANESPELREVHRFEERVFPRLGDSELLDGEPDDAALPLPPGLGGRWGGSINGAMFLKEFVDPKTPWAHLDIAGTAWKLGRPYAQRGGSAYGLRLLVDWVQRRTERF